MLKSRTMLSPHVALLLALAVLGGSGLAQAQTTDHCIVADVPEPMLLPDGSSYPAGALRLCYQRFNPVTGLHRTYVNGVFAGMFFSRLGKSEGPVDETRPFMLFERTGEGMLELRAYAVPRAYDGRLENYRMAPIGREVDAEPLIARVDSEAAVVLLAALTP